MSWEDLLRQMKSDNEDIKLKLDAILNALVVPRLGETKREIEERIQSQVRGELARKVWNAINGQRTIAEIGKNVKRKQQVVLRYIKRWEQSNPPLVYVSMMKEGAKVYKRVFEIRLRKPRNKKESKKTEKKRITEQNSTEEALEDKQ